MQNDNANEQGNLNKGKAIAMPDQELSERGRKRLRARAIEGEGERD